MTETLVFDPLLPWFVIVGLSVLTLMALGLAIWRGLSGWILRALAAVVVLAYLSGPVWQQEERNALTDIVLLLEDQSSSQRLGARAEQSRIAADALAARISARADTEVRRLTIPDGEDDAGTEAMRVLADALADEPLARVAGVIVVSDGRVHDMTRAPELPAPLHLLMSGQPDDWDRRLIVENAPGFAILGEPVTLRLMIEDQGAMPTGSNRATLEVSIDGAEAQSFQVPIGEPIEMPVTLPHGGRNVLRFSVPEADGELTDRNNSAVVQINGVRDRLRVLLVSGEPHAGGRTWRNLLKSDSSVDLVHFTILRPPEKQDGVPVTELSLIAFPTRELFLEKIEDFDLIIFDRYKRRGILPSLYLENVRSYVEKGGAVLVAAGPDYASADSLYRSPLGEILPAAPTARVIDQGYLPEVSELGERHPVTEGLTAQARAASTADDPEAAPWGRWLRQIDVEVATSGQESPDVVMTGIEGRPLLVLDRVGEGRVALLASDQAWLWSRGFEGGGPQLELLRRLAHWMMKEPELEEEALWAEATGQRMRIIRRSLSQDVDAATVTAPDGSERIAQLEEVAPGRYEAFYDGDEIGLYRLTEGDQSAVIGLGPATPKEFEETIASDESLAPLLKAGRGGALPLYDGIPTVRDVRAGRPAAGRNWIGITPRNAYQTRSVTQTPLLSGWLVLFLAALLTLGAWLREGRR